MGNRTSLVALAVAAACAHGGEFAAAEADGTPATKAGAASAPEAGGAPEAGDIPDTAVAARPTDEAPQTLAFEAVLRIDAEPGYKAFQGVWLERDDGERWVVDYRAKPWWRPFEGLRVAVRGHRYTPRGQAPRVPHFEVTGLEPLDPSAEVPRSLGAERELQGRLDLYTWPAGTKLAGETVLVFLDDEGTQYWLAGSPGDLPEPGTSLAVRARGFEPSPFVSRPGGPYLWLVAWRADRPAWTEVSYDR